MHHLYFVLLEDAEIADSMDARNQAVDLLEEEGFCAQGYFGFGKGDWYVVGGRWSGELDSVQGRHAAEGNQYEPYGHERDAQKLTPKLAEALEKRYHDKPVDVFDKSAYDEITTSHLPAREYLGRWLVVIDYHT